ncbi:hypothetical protein PG984_013507 [Apiospora sp. TS-2023a]
MDSEVLQNIDLFPAANSKSFIDNSSSCLRQLSSISFWDNFDNGLPQQQNVNHPLSPPVTEPKTRNGSLSPPLAKKEILSKSSRISKSGSKGQQLKKSLKRKQDYSALDCTDYWLRFDSDDESLDKSEFDNQTRRPFDFIHPSARSSRVTSFDSVKPDFPSMINDFVDSDSALDHALSSEEEAFAMALDDDYTSRGDQTPLDVIPERLYSTPLSWEPPQPGLRMESSYNSPVFNDPERQRLLAIAMGTGLPPINTTTRAGAAVDYFNFEKQRSPSSTSETASDPPPEMKRRKSSVAGPMRSGQTTPADIGDRKDRPRNSDRAAHNDIERKYRTNLKDRIADLREAIPSLRSIPEDDDDSPVPASKAPKVSKGTILTKATEYIHQLERRNRNMAHKNDELTRRLQAFEQLLGAGHPTPSWQPQGYGGPVFQPRGYGA